MPKWEYAQIEKRHVTGHPGRNPLTVVGAWGISWPGDHSLGEIFPKLNELGKQGWELGVRHDRRLLSAERDIRRPILDQRKWRAA